MRKDLARWIVTALSVAVLLTFSSTRAVGQDNQEKHEPQGVNPAGGGVPAVSLKHFEAKSSGPAPRTADGKPDLSAVWGPGLNMGNIAVNLKPGEELPLQPWALKLTQDRSTPEAKRTDPKPNCLPDGVPREDPFPYKIVQTPKLMRHAGRRHGGIQRQDLVRWYRPPAYRAATCDRALSASRFRAPGVRGYHRRSGRLY